MELEQSHAILLVDDEESITRSLKRLFRKQKFTILSASGGKAALDIIKNSKDNISLIITDQKMPVMTGTQFLEKAKDIIPDAIRFLLTGYSDMDTIIDAVDKCQIHRYLTKPWNDKDLILQVQHALELYELRLENKRLIDLTQKQNIELKRMNSILKKKMEKKT